MVVLHIFLWDWFVSQYIIRTDVMYERVDKRCDTPEGREAYRVRDAE